ncbi:hypothetical protein RQP53_08885 [Paucibacter sp. APW11]|uniref:GyrI-like small molecule binding domain-containing protein n=1 Tax=Roseateles aquae TaxID=3077235 RepID=A0ABU3P9Z3_9BURK|nr:hypothetical protein [Paucibacter sp. APW11]MDT8999378.1 hypothetical protein [Paucibacter sp. APW11]
MSLHPDYPIVTGSYQMTDEWAVTLPDEFNRRIEDGSLVLWRPALTFWISIWGNDKDTSEEKRLASILETASDLRGEQQIERADKLVRLTYELPEEDRSRSKSDYKSISGYVITPIGHIQISAYFDTPAARTLGYRIIHSVRNVA